MKKMRNKKATLKKCVLFFSLSFLLVFSGNALLAQKSTAEITANKIENKKTVSSKPISSKPIFGAQSFTLENGLMAVWVPNHRSPVAHHMIWYKVGAADEDVGKSGIAHFFEHLMFKGTPKYPDAVFSKTINAIGGRDNAFTSSDYTAYYQSIPKEHLALVMDMEADRMQNLILTKEIIETERQVILEERKQRVDTSAFARYSEKENALLYVNHPYAIPVIGWEHEIRNLSEQDLLDFYKKWYAPNNAIVVVAGDINFEEFKKLVETHYGALKPSPHIKDRARPEIPQGIFNNLKLDLHFSDAQIAQNYLRKRMLVPSQKQDSQTSFALSIIAEELGSGESSLLYKELVTRQRKAISVGSVYSGESKDTGSFIFYATLAKDISFDAVEKEIDIIIDNFVQEGISQERLEEIKERMAASAIYARDSLDTPAYIFGKSLSIGLTMDDVEYWQDKLESVTKEQVDAVLREYFSPEKRETLISGYLTHKKTAEGE